MEFFIHNGVRLAVTGRELKITSVGDILDLLSSVSYPEACAGIVLKKESLPEHFLI